MTEAEQIKETMVTQYNNEAHAYDDKWVTTGDSASPPEPPASTYFVNRKVNTAIAMSAATDDMSVLEIGSKIGNMTFRLAERFTHVTASDISPDSLELVRKRAEHFGVTNVTIKVGDAEKISELCEDTFDRIFSFSTLRYVPRLDVAIKEIFKAVKSGGSIIIDFPNTMCPWFGILRWLTRGVPHAHDHRHTRRELLSLLKDAGFVNIETRYLLFVLRQLPTSIFRMVRLPLEIMEHIPLLKYTAGILMIKADKP